MAVILIPNRNYFQCLAADSKPTAVTVGDEIFESDTGATYRWTGTVWVKSDSAAIESTTNARKGISYPHAEAHGGRAYLSIYSALKDDTEFIEVRIQSANTARLSHMTIHIEAALAATAQFWQDTTKTDVGGNRLAALNRRFDSLNVTGMLNCHTPGGANTGAADITRYIGSASASGRTDIGGGAGSRGEFILDQNSDHDILLTSRADNNALSIELDWYEHTDK
jgi:hypothetical protein